jgi:transcriptional regulator with XRE-family HTH domain
MTQREVAAIAGTSQATVSAYEAGRKQPSLVTFERLLRTCGARLDVRRDRPRAWPELQRAGARLAEVLALAEALPYRPGPVLRYPRLAR